MRPTEMAALNFRNAGRKALLGASTLEDIAMAVGYLAQGLEDMNTGLRATYMKLEALESLIRGPGGPGSGITAAGRTINQIKM